MCLTMPYGWYQISWSVLVQVMACGWWHQAITWTNVDLSWKVFHSTHLRPILHEMLKILILRISLWITNLWLQLPLWGVMRGQVVNQGNIFSHFHYNDVIMSMIASQITSLKIVYTTVYSDTDQRKYQSSVSLAFVWGNHRGPVNSPHKWPVTWKMFPFYDVIMPLTLLSHRENNFTQLIEIKN